MPPAATLCRNCPWRRDSPKAGEPGGTVPTRPTVAGMRLSAHEMTEGWKVMQCHHSTDRDPRPCAGFLSVVGYDSIGVRLGVLGDVIRPEDVGRPLPDLYRSLPEMIREANHIDIGPRVLERCPTCRRELRRARSRHKCPHGVPCGIAGREQLPWRSRTCHLCNLEIDRVQKRGAPMSGQVPQKSADCVACFQQKGEPCDHHRGPDGVARDYAGPELYEPTDWVLSVVGRRYRSHRGVTLCTGYDRRAGFWMKIDPGGEILNVSERAIGRTFHELS